jgi:ABC-type branched-subunit amino acid transport system permease subunit
MRSRLQRWKPAQLLWVIGIANLASALAVLVVVALSLHLTEGQRLPLQVKIPAFLAIGVSYTASLIAESAVQRGIRYHLWPDSLLAPPRKLLSHPAVAVITAIMMTGTLILIIILPLRNTPLGTLFLILPLSFSRVNYSLNPPSADPLSTITPSALYPSKPLHSNQWGK